MNSRNSCTTSAATRVPARAAWEATVRAWSREDHSDAIRAMKVGEAMLYAATDLICALEERLALADSLIVQASEEFGCTLEQYHKVGPHWTMKDGTETFDVAVILDRSELIECMREYLSSAEGVAAPVSQEFREDQ